MLADDVNAQAAAGAQGQKVAVRGFDRGFVDDSEESYLRNCWSQNVCPYCRRGFPPTSRVGGSPKKGGFCSVKCYGDYYAL
jgi:hypothetical protein